MANIKFTINGKVFMVSNNLSVDTPLSSFIRQHANLSGTKTMCNEGGCGACVVTVASEHPVTKEPQIYSVNSCLVSIFSCHGWAITTVEGLGDQTKGYHPIQRRLAAFNGTQCGYCTPGWVMNMHSLYEDHKEKLTMAEIENSFASNICRCTGYRPILDAFKTFARDCDPGLLKQVDDIEDLSGIKMCAKNGLICTKICKDYSFQDDSCKIKMERSLRELSLQRKSIKLNVFDNKWFKVYQCSEIFDIIESEGKNGYALVAGNTAKGVYELEIKPKVMIDISDVSELKAIEIKDGLALGGNITLSDAMKIFQHVSQMDHYKYAGQLYQHMDLIAHIPVRNIGTLAGNLNIKHQHNDFQSDIFVLLETIGAILTIASKHEKFQVSLKEYLATNMQGRIIKNINLPKISDEYEFYSYKVMPRAQNSHAHVNAGFLLKFASDRSYVESASLVYGGISPKFIHATSTERFLQGKNIFDKEVLRQALRLLTDEINPEEAPPEPSAKYRKMLAVNLFYKFILRITPSNLIDSSERSGGEEFIRPVSSGKQDFDTKKEVWPLNKPVPKIEALVQCSGEAKYVNDIPSLPEEVHAAFVLAKVHSGIIDDIDAKKALEIKGVIAVFTAKDIPGINSFAHTSRTIEEVFCSGKILYHGQPVALVVANTHKLANIAADIVKINYKELDNNPPNITARQALRSKDVQERLLREMIIEPQTEQGSDITKVLKGSLDIFGQYHYTMETQACICVPTEDGIDIYPATQWMDIVQFAVSQVLKIPENRINIQVRRLGGGYGSKISRPALTVSACALAAVKLSRPVRFVMSLRANMKAIGKRLPYASDYEVGVNNDGKIQYLHNKFYADDGSNHNDKITLYTLRSMPSCYDCSNWTLDANSILTDTACNTACRSPGTTEAVAMTENIMEHIAIETKNDPLKVRLINMDLKDNPLPELIEDLKKSADYEKRHKDVEMFNKQNRWRKRGINILPLKYDFYYWGRFYAKVCIYHDDGSVAISHGGIEMGQGLNTKVAQVCSHILGVPMEKIMIKPSNNFTAPNCIATGASMTSESCCYATMKCCETILERLEPIKKQMDDPSWVQLIQKAHDSLIDLSAQYMFTANDDVKSYPIWAVTIAEVEIDVLTGNHQVLRVDILEDTGESLSPQVDIGQVEGAFVMGLGYWTSEKLVYDQNTGELLTDRTWNYKPPGAKDIPIDFRVSFRRNAPNPLGVLRSKATGEPSLSTSSSVVFAIRQAIHSAKIDNGFPENKWFNIEMPYTAENILLAINADKYE